MVVRQSGTSALLLTGFLQESVFKVPTDCLINFWKTDPSELRQVRNIYQNFNSNQSPPLTSMTLYPVTSLN